MYKQNSPKIRQLQEISDFLFGFFMLYYVYGPRPGDKNISILYLSCRTSDLHFSLMSCTCPFKVYAIKNTRG